MDSLFDENMRELWSRIQPGSNPVVGRRPVWEPAQRVGVASLANHHPAWPNRPAAAVPSVDFVGRGLPVSGKLHQFWFGCCLTCRGRRHMMGMRRSVVESQLPQVSIETLPGLGNPGRVKLAGRLGVTGPPVEAGWD